MDIPNKAKYDKGGNSTIKKKKKNVPEKILGIAASWHGTDLTYSSKVSQPLHHMSWIQNVPWDFTTSKTHWEIVQKETKRHMPNSCHRPF